jgi:hypothetical protein
MSRESTVSCLQGREEEMRDQMRRIKERFGWF